MKSSTFKAWITKHALTQGILEREVQLRNASIDSNMIEIVGGSHLDIYHGEGRDWHRTKESAIKRADEMRQRKIASLEKQIKQLQDLKFE